MKQRIIILITLGLMATATSWADNHLEAVASNETETAQPEAGYDLGTATDCWQGCGTTATAWSSNYSKSRYNAR